MRSKTESVPKDVRGTKVGRGWDVGEVTDWVQSQSRGLVLLLILDYFQTRTGSCLVLGDSMTLSSKVNSVRFVKITSKGRPCSLTVKRVVPLKNKVLFCLSYVKIIGRLHYLNGGLLSEIQV